MTDTQSITKEPVKLISWDENHVKCYPDPVLTSCARALNNLPEFWHMEIALSSNGTTYFTEEINKCI